VNFVAHLSVVVSEAAICLTVNCCVAAKPIDLLARYISAEDDDLAIEMHEPYTYLNVCMLLCVLKNDISLP